MKISIKEAFMSVFQDPKWTNKFILGVIFVSVYQLIDVAFVDFVQKSQKSSTEMFATKLGYEIIGITLLLKAFACVMYLFAVGYIIKYAHNKINEVKPDLPNWGNYFKQGLLYYLISIFYAVLIMTPILALNLNELNMYIGICFLSILLLPFMSFAAILYAKDLNFNNAFDFKNIFSIFKRVIKTSYLYSLFLFPLALWSYSYDIIKILHINYILKVPLVLAFGFIEFWLYLASMNIFIQIYKLSEFRKLQNQ